jgi:hypothetical protein
MRRLSGTTFCIFFLMAATVLPVSAAENETLLRATANYLSPEVERVLAEGEFELLSLDPTPLTDKQRGRLRTKLFHGYRVLGTMRVQKGTQRDRLLQALRHSIADSRGTYVYCFDPRHAIRASTGTQTVDLVICFECERIEMYSPDKSLVGTDATAQPALDVALKRAGVPLGKRP